MPVGVNAIGVTAAGVSAVSGQGPAAGSVADQWLAVGPARLDYWGKLEFAGRSLRLTQIQARILELLARRFPNPIAREALIAAMYAARPDGGPDGADECLRQHLLRVRQKLRVLGVPVRIETLWGRGLVLVA